MITQQEARIIGRLLDGVLPTIHPAFGAVLVAKGLIRLDGTGTVNGIPSKDLPVVTDFGRSMLHDYIENLPSAGS